MARGPLAADFRRFYGLSLSGIRETGIPLGEVADLAMYLPPESAVRRHLDEHWQRTPELGMLQAIEHSLRVLAWMRTKDAPKGKGYPEPIRFPWDPPPEGVLRGDSMTFEEADAFLGWDKIKAGQPSEEV